MNTEQERWDQAVYYCIHNIPIDLTWGGIHYQTWNGRQKGVLFIFVYRQYNM